MVKILLIEFPISGDLRLPLLIMEWIFIITCFEISLIFLVRYKNQEKVVRNLQDLGYFSVFFGFALMWLFYIIGDYYSPDEVMSPFLIWSHGSVRTLFLNFGYFTIMIAVFFLLLSVEKYNVFLFKRYFFTVIFSICSILFIILFFIDIRITQPITYVFWIGFLFFFTIFLIKFFNILKSKILLLFSGLILMLIGFLLTTDALIEALGFEGRLLGAIFQLISVILLFYFFSILPPFNEFDWQEKVEAVFLVNNAGICLYYKYFKEKELINENLISAAILSINVTLKEMIGQDYEDISVFKKQHETVVIYPGKFLTGVLYISEDLMTPRIVLKNFVDKFELIYRNILLDWDGETKIFNQAESIVKDIFLS